jgi:uncharacterized protein (TIGR02145 family)
MYLDVNNVSTKYTITDAYFSDNSGNRIAGLPSLGPPFASYATPPNPKNIQIPFAGFNSDYAAAGFTDYDSDGVYDDVLTGQRINIVFEFECDVNLSTSCAPLLLNEYFNSSFYYHNNCNTRAALGAQNSLCLARLGYAEPSQAVVNPPNLFKNMNNITISFSQPQVSAAPNSGMPWPLNVSNYDHYILITLPEEFDYDDTRQGIRINSSFMPALTDVTKQTVIKDGTPRVQLVIHNKLANHVASISYSIDVYTTNNLTNHMDKSMRIEHEFAFKDENTHFKYACFDLPPLNFQVHGSGGCFSIFYFDVQRMTFGWTDYNKTTRITTANIASYPGVNRDVAGPYDNVDMTCGISVSCAIPYTGDNDWMVDLGYNAPLATGNCFFFPNPDTAVIVERQGYGTFYIPESGVTVIPGAGNHYILRVNITDWTIDCVPPFLSNVTADDTIHITYKMRANENMPKVLTLLYNMTMTTYLLDNTGDPDIWLKNYWVVDYAVKDFLGPNTSYTNYYENEQTTLCSIDRLYVTPNPMASYRFFTNEYRPDQYATYYEVKFKSLWNIDNAQLQEVQYNDINPSSPAAPNVLSAADWNVTHDSDGSTTFLISDKIVQSNQIAVNQSLFNWFVNGHPYCAIYDTVLYSKVRYQYYPSSEKQDATGEFTRPLRRAYSNRYMYTTALTAQFATVYPVTNEAVWNITLTNMSNWAGTDRLIPNCWLAVTIPPDVDYNTLLLSDGANTWNFGAFVLSGGKYWAKLGDLTFINTKNFTLSCRYSSCEAFNIGVSFGQSRIGYPVDPDIGFGTATPPCPNTSSLALYAIPEVSALRGLVTSPPFDNIPDQSYNFCEPHTFTATFVNTEPSELTTPVLTMSLCTGLELISTTLTATQNGSPVTIQSIDDSGPGSERDVTITLDPATILTSYGTANASIVVSFDLKPVCDFGDSYIVYVTFSANNLCGKLLRETKNTVPIKVEGTNVSSDYLIPSFSAVSSPIAGALDLSNATTAASSQILVEATIQQNSSTQDPNDYIAISIPPHMNITSGTPTFTFWKIENGNRIYKAPMPALATIGATTDIEAVIKPNNPELWDCKDIDILIFTGTFVPLLCDLTVCDVDVKHKNEEKETFSVIKNVVDFVPGTVRGAGVYNTSSAENVTFSGNLTVPAESNMQDLVIEVFSNRSGTLQPVGVSFTIPSIITDASTTVFDFGSSPALTIPATEMCHLYLVIRKGTNYNEYICNNVSIQVPPPSYTLTNSRYEICQYDTVTVGDQPITGYTYEWTPDVYTIITGDYDTTPIRVSYPDPYTGDQTLSLAVNRGGCTVPATATVHITERAADGHITLSDRTVCAGETNTFTPQTTIANPVFLWYNSQTSATPFFRGPFYTTSLTENTTFYISVSGSNYCENPVNARKPVAITAAICTLLDCSNLTDRIVDENGVRLGYTHAGNAWDAIPETAIDSMQYFINGVLYSSGTAPSLDGAHFEVGVSTVTVYVYLNTEYLDHKIDSCKFLVTVERVCPTSVDDIESHTYTVTKLAGLCWTENLQSTLYSSDATTIPVATVYTCSDCPARLDTIFGLLYTWYSAVYVPEGSTVAPVPDANGFVQGICPNGFHVPSQAEWARLEPYPASQLRSTQYWLNPPGPGTDDYGFDARPAGWYNGAIDRYQDLYGFTGWWAAEDSGSGGSASYSHITYYCNVIEHNMINKIDELSVRCVMDY